MIGKFECECGKFYFKHFDIGPMFLFLFGWKIYFWKCGSVAHKWAMKYRKEPIARLQMRENSFLSKPTFQICGCFVHHIQVLHLLWYCNNCGALLKNDSITQTSDRYINSDNMMMFKGKKVGLDTYKTYVICVNLWDSLTSLYL